MSTHAHRTEAEITVVFAADMSSERLPSRETRMAVGTRMYLARFFASSESIEMFGVSVALE
jgi:hypothetical protein